MLNIKGTDLIVYSTADEKGSLKQDVGFQKDRDEVNVGGEEEEESLNIITAAPVSSNR